MHRDRDVLKVHAFAQAERRPQQRRETDPGILGGEERDAQSSPLRQGTLGENPLGRFKQRVGHARSRHDAKALHLNDG